MLLLNLKTVMIIDYFVHYFVKIYLLYVVLRYLYIIGICRVYVVTTLIFKLHNKLLVSFVCVTYRSSLTVSGDHGETFRNRMLFNCRKVIPKRPIKLKNAHTLDDAM